DLSEFNWLLLGGYVAAELLIYAAGTALFHYGFKRGFRESFLLAHCAVFANHVLYLLPIAIYAFGEEAAAELVTFIAADLIVIYGGTLILLDATSGTGPVSPVATAGRMVRNPQIIAIAAGFVA